MRKKRRPFIKIFVKALFITALLLAFVGFIVFGAYETVTYGNFQTLSTWIDRFAGMGTEIEPVHLIYDAGDTGEEYHDYGLSEYEPELYEQEYVYRPEPPIYVLEDFMQQFGNTVSVYYENMATGFVFRHNADHQYFGASATKAPFALYIYLKTERGEASMDTVTTYTSADFWAGSGVIRHRYSVGQGFTQRQLLHLMITPSDNIATRMLRRVHGLDGYKNFVESIGANPDFVQNLTFSYLSANDAGIFLREMYLYIESNGRYSHELRDNMLANRYAFIISDYPVASKSGWAANYGAAWHDMAIVYAPSPYILALLSSRAGNAADRVVYDAISMFVQEFNTKWFCP